MFLFLGTQAQTAALDEILNSSDLSGATVAVTVTTPDGTVLYSRNGSLRVSPASNEKLFSAAFALYQFGPDYRPSTRFWKLSDRIVVDSVGDPAITHGDLVKASQAIGVRDLPVYIHQSYDPEIPDTWEIGDLPNRYAAPVSAFSVDQGGFELWNSNGSLQLRPERYGARIKFEGRKGKPGFTYDPIRRIVHAHGKFPKKTVRLDTLGVPNSAEAASSLIGPRWFSTKDIPSESPTYEIHGQRLADTMQFCLQHSDNIMAENLLLMGGSHVKPLDMEDPYQDAISALKEFESRVVGLNPIDLHPMDGSGLTRDNFVTTNAVTSLLNWAQKQPTSSVWKQSLAAPGVGTLIHRLPGVDFHGKTGSLSHVTALSGYLVTSESKNLTISVIFNNFTCSEEKARGVIDKFVKFIYEKGP